jgi:hypothetical protein
VNDSPPPWRHYADTFVFNVSALRFDEQGRPLAQDPAKVWRHCRGADLDSEPPNECLSG